MRKREYEDNESSSESKRQKLERSDTESGVHGTIESISLCNFMCHENLQFEFGPHINFIIGRNGSGKSAILTGIILALGGKSKATGRYNAIKGFVQKGKQKAKLQVVLRNCGEQAYKPEVYGSKVIVIREISLEGVSNYKLKSASGKIVSTHKEELNNILTAMDIQIENPISALTQENSKSFLTCKKPDKLYQYYFQGSGLETLEKSYASTHLTYKDAAEDLQRKKELLPEKEKELVRWKKVLDSSAKVHDYKIELLWATVIELEKRFKSIQEEIVTLQKKLFTFQQQKNNFKEKVISNTTNMDKYQKEREECDTIMIDIRNKLTVLKSDRDNRSTELRMLKSKLSSLKRDEALTSEEKTRLEKCIEGNLMSDQNELNEEKSRREDQIQNLEGHIQEINEGLVKLSRDKEDYLKQQLSLIGKQEMVQNDICNYKRSQQGYQKALNRLENGLKNKVNVFGLPTQNILNEIEAQKHRFSKPPKGPIGMYLEVIDSRWCAAVEECISTRLLHAYCCDNVNDSLKLSEILRKFYPQDVPTVLISKYVSQMHDVSKYSAVTGFSTVLNMLRISDPVIANVLIDNCHIESKVLIEDTNTAVSAMVQNPKNCSGAFLMNCSTIVLNPYRFYSNEKRGKTLLSSVGKKEIELAKKDITICESALESLESQKHSLMEQRNQIPGMVNVLDKKIIRLNQSKQEALYAIKDLSLVHDPRDAHCMQEDLLQLQKEHDKMKAQVEMRTSEFQEKLKVYEVLMQDIQRYKELLKEENQKHSNLGSELNTCGEEKERCISALKRLETEISNCKILLKSTLKEAEKIQKHVQRAVKTAEEAGPRRETDRSCEDLSRLLAETEKTVQEQSNCNRDELLQKYREKCKAVENIKRDFNKIENRIKSIYNMYRQRKNQFKTISTITQHYIEYAYSSHLNKLYTGKLNFDNKARTLSLEATPNKSNSEAKKKGGKCISLSGGERSYITIAFLLALWDRITSPFKILDEYDVFMDSNNRNLSISLLTEQAEAVDSQFIFLSPLDLPEIKASPLIKIHQMKEPKREEMGSQS